MQRKFAVTALVAGALSVAAPTASLATTTGNRGQPNQNCEALSASPAGFGTSGFQHATTVYAGSGKSATHAASGSAVSQYDVACFQLSTR